MTVEERVTLIMMRLQGSSLSTIAAVLVRHSSTLNQEVLRQLEPGYYDATVAGARAYTLKHITRRRNILAPNSELPKIVRNLLTKG